MSGFGSWDFGPGIQGLVFWVLGLGFRVNPTLRAQAPIPYISLARIPILAVGPKAITI